MRLTQLDERAAVNTEGPLTFNDQERSRSRSSAFEYHGELGGQAVGIAVLDHVRNLGSPTPSYAIRSAHMSFFTPAVLCYSPYEMARGDGITLRFRVLVHRARWDAARLLEELERR